MFDGLDEIFDTSDRGRVMQEITGFAQRYPRARIIVTSRPVGYKEQVLRGAGFRHFGMQDLDDGQINSFIRGWFSLTFPQQPRQAEQRIERVLGSVRQLKPIRLLAGNPMLLTIMALLAREEELPRERAKFYEKAVEVLCHHWDANRNLKLPEDRYLNADDKKDLLRRIAMHMQTGEAGLKGNIIQEDDLEQVIQAYLIDQWQLNAAEAKKAARRMIRQLRERNYILCLRGPHLYGFVHRTFLEYLTAAEYVRWFDRQPQQMTIDELVELFDQHCRDDEWREVLRLICGQIDEQFVGRIVEHLATLVKLEQWDGETPLPELPLAIWCLTEVRGTTRLTSAGAQTLEKIIGCARNGTDSSGLFLMDQLLPACKELGERWPGRDMLVTFERSALDGVPNFGWGEDFWPPFIAAVLGSREAVKWLADTTEGAIDGAFYRSAALRALAEKWPDETTRKLLAERAVQDDNYVPRRAALQALAEKWPDETMRKLLAERAVKDKHGDARSGALQALAEKWPDETTRKLLAERAVQDDNYVPRRAALRMLAEKWPDEITRKLLAERAVDASFTRDQRGMVCVALGKMHSDFGRIVFTKDLDGVAPFLDPDKPISKDHIKRAAKKAHVPVDEVDEITRSLSAHLGWDIAKGAAG